MCRIDDQPAFTGVLLTDIVNMHAAQRVLGETPGSTCSPPIGASGSASAGTAAAVVRTQGAASCIRFDVRRRSRGRDDPQRCARPTERGARWRRRAHGIHAGEVVHNDDGLAGAGSSTSPPASPAPPDPTRSWSHADHSAGHLLTDLVLAVVDGFEQARTSPGVGPKRPTSRSWRRLRRPTCPSAELTTFGAVVAARPCCQFSGWSAADLTVAAHDVLRRGQLAQPHRPAGVQLLGRDADLGAEAELLAVDEPGRRVARALRRRRPRR